MLCDGVGDNAMKMNEQKKEIDEREQKK